MQLYFDFSGYSDMAIGLAMLFNVRLPDNFDAPYRAGSIAEFCRRWHMTLSGFRHNQSRLRYEPRNCIGRAHN
jgi:D-alanyl-lipoteichoic acid acyltransferase DltB (MBOAT superfamily)